MKCITKHTPFVLIALVLTLAVSRKTAWGGAIDVPMQDAKAAAQADAFTAQADDPSAIFYNPAGLTQLHGTQASLGALYLQPIFHFKGDDGSNERMNIPSVLPHIYVESDLGTERFRIGLGLNAIDGINEDWGSHGPLRDIEDKAQLQVINIAPTLAYKVDDHLSLGVAFNVYYGYLDLERNVPLGAPPTPEGHFRVHGNDFSYGFTPSVMYKINDQNQVGVYYRSPFKLDFEGKARVASSVIPEIGPSAAHESLNLPQSIGAGYAVHPTPPLTLEADAIWTDWHAVDQLQIVSPDAHFNGQTLPAHWKSGWTFRGGVQYWLDRHWALRAGYAYGQNSVPQSTYSPLVPDSNYHLGSLGLGYSADAWSLDFAYEFIYRERRHIENNAYSPTTDGTWDNVFHGLMLTYTMRF